MKKLFFATAMAAVLTGCACQKSTMKDAMTHEWNIDKIDGQALENKGEKTPFIGLDVEKSRVYGNASCNSLTGDDVSRHVHRDQDYGGSLKSEEIPLHKVRLAHPHRRQRQGSHRDEREEIDIIYTVIIAVDKQG